MIGSWHATVFDCADPDSLASFYESLLGMIRVEHEHEDDGLGTRSAL